MLVEIIVGDFENEFHGLYEKFNVDIISNNPKKDFLEALEKGEKLLGISLRKDQDLKTISYEIISTLMDAGFDINSLDLEVYPNEPYKISPLDYLLINIFLAKKGNPKLEIKELEELTPQIELGGVGCFIY